MNASAQILSATAALSLIQNQLSTATTILIGEEHPQARRLERIALALSIVEADLEEIKDDLRVKQ